MASVFRTNLHAAATRRSCLQLDVQFTCAVDSQMHESYPSGGANSGACSVEGNNGFRMLVLCQDMAGALRHYLPIHNVRHQPPEKFL